MAAAETTSFLAVFGRLTWMLLGPMALLILTGAIVSSKGGWLTVADIAYFVALGAMLLGRWLEFQGGNPQKATGEPATRDDLRRYLLVAGPMGLAVWVIANLIGNHWLAN